MVSNIKKGDFNINLMRLKTPKNKNIMMETLTELQNIRTLNGSKFDRKIEQLKRVDQEFAKYMNEDAMEIGGSYTCFNCSNSKYDRQYLMEKIENLLNHAPTHIIKDDETYFPQLEEKSTCDEISETKNIKDMSLISPNKNIVITKISPGQAILFILDTNNKQYSDANTSYFVCKEKRDELEKIYLFGSDNTMVWDEIEAMLPPYLDIDYTPETKNNDTTKRFLETNIANIAISELDMTEEETTILDEVLTKSNPYPPLMTNLTLVSMKENGANTDYRLNDKTNRTIEQFVRFIYACKEIIEYDCPILNGVYEEHPDYTERGRIKKYNPRQHRNDELIDNIRNLRTKISTLKHQIKDIKEKIDSLDKESVALTQLNNKLKNLNTELATAHTELNRNKKNLSTPIRLINLGTLRSIDPVPDVLRLDFTNGKYDTTEVSTRITDDSKTDYQAKVPQKLLKLNTNYYVNGTSGMVLSMIKVLIMHFSPDDNKAPKITMKQFNTILKGTISALLLVEGGHSIPEFFLVFKIPEIECELQKIISGYEEPSINLFMNEFKEALDSSTVFNRTLIHKKLLYTELLDISRIT